MTRRARLKDANTRDKVDAWRLGLTDMPIEVLMQIATLVPRLYAANSSLYALRLQNPKWRKLQAQAFVHWHARGNDELAYGAYRIVVEDVQSALQGGVVTPDGESAWGGLPVASDAFWMHAYALQKQRPDAVRLPLIAGMLTRSDDACDAIDYFLSLVKRSPDCTVVEHAAAIETALDLATDDVLHEVSEAQRGNLFASAAELDARMRCAEWLR